MGKELELAIKISGKLDKSLGTAVHSAQAQLNSIAKGTNRAMTLATTAVVAATAKVVKDSVQTYQDYQSALNSAAATGNIERGSAAYNAMNEAAREAGRTTVKTAKESANALEYMMLAGWSVENSTKALMPVLKLSASTGADLATTSDLVTDSMANLGLTINNLPHYLDVAAAANNKTNQTATQLQEAYLGVGGTLKNINAPIEESAAILGVLANRGTKGSEAGTALSAILVNMQKRGGEAYKAMNQLGVSMYDTNGNARSIIDVFQDISNKTSGMTEQNRNLMYQMIGGKSHVDSFAKIMQGFGTQTADGATEVYSLIEAFKNCDGALDKLYDIKMDTLEGSVFRLSSAFDDMKISIGERLAPTLQEAFNNLADKMPAIGEVIIAGLEKIIPAASHVLNYLVDNADNIVSTVYRIAFAFGTIKIGSSVIRGVDTMIKLGSALSKISKAAGAGKVIKGVIGSFTGISTAAGTVSATVMSAIGPITVVTAGIIALGVAIKTVYGVWYNHNYKWGDSLEKQANAISGQVKDIEKLSGYKKELSDLELIVKSPNSTAEQVNSARERITEIGELLSRDYNLNINTNTGDLAQVVEDVKTVVDALNIKQRRDVDQDIAQYLGDVNGTVEKYKTAKASYAAEQAKHNSLVNNNKLISGLLSSAVTQASAYDMSGDVDTYIKNMQGIANKLKSAGLFDKINEHMVKAINPDKIFEELNNVDALQDFLNALHNADSDINREFAEFDKKFQDTSNSINNFESSARTAAESLNTLMVDDILSGDKVNLENDISRFESLGKAMVSAGANTDDIATKFSMAKEGFTNFATAVSSGAAEKVAQNFIDYKMKIGESAESAVQGAALIQNGFQNAAEATAAGGDAINNVITTLKALGDTQGIFDGINSDDGIADKLSDMVHAMNLIPQNKTVTIDANGNFQVIEEAENQIASLKSVGNVDVSVNANGDFSVLNEVTGELQTLRGLGAVSLQINAQGNIDVLNDANVAIAQIDKQTGKVIYVDASVEPGEVETGGFKEKVGAMLRNSFGTMTAYAEEIPVDVNVKPGNINTASFDSVFMQRSQALFGGQPKTVNIAVNGQVSGMEQLSSAQQIASRLRSAFVTQTVAGSYPGQEQIAAAVDNQSKLASVATTQTVNGSFPGQAAIATAIWYQNQLHNKTVTHKVIYEQEGTPPANNAAGTTHFKGGLTYVNDQNISDPREVIEHNGTRYWFEGRNVLLNVPKGARIYNASQSRPIINGSHRSGLARVPFDGYLAELHRNERVLTASEASEYSGDGFSDYMRKMKSVLTGQRRGGDPDSSGKTEGETSVVFAPKVYVSGDADRNEVNEGIKMSFYEFKRMMDEYERDKRRKKF